MLVRIIAPHFIAGIEFHHGKITNIAPIIKWMKGREWDVKNVIEYCRLKGWRYEVYSANASDVDGSLWK